MTAKRSNSSTNFVRVKAVAQFAGLVGLPRHLDLAVFVQFGGPIGLICHVGLPTSDRHCYKAISVFGTHRLPQMPASSARRSSASSFSQHSRSPNGNCSS